MTVTIAARWRVTFRVHSLARVTMPVTAPKITRREKDKESNVLALVQSEQLKHEMAATHHRWETDALLSAQQGMFR